MIKNEISRDMKPIFKSTAYVHINWTFTAKYLT